MELGLYTFVERSPHISAEQRMRNLMEEVELADQVGLDVFGIGEHHRPDYMVSTPAVVLAAAAQRTMRRPFGLASTRMGTSPRPRNRPPTSSSGRCRR